MTNLIHPNHVFDGMFSQANSYEKGSCMWMSESVVDFLLKKGRSDFKIIEGYVSFPEDKNLRFEHTWIEFDDGKIFDPTKTQFKGWNIENIIYIPGKSYSPDEYLKLCKLHPIPEKERYPIDAENILKNSKIEFSKLFSQATLWEEVYPAGQAMMENANKWIHFTDLPKLGINPQKSHKDPHGVYFYHAKWLLENYSGFQYGMVKPHAYMVDINTRGANGINLGKMTDSQAQEISSQNGWLKYYNMVKRDPEKYLSEGPMDSKMWRTIGGIFYATGDALANSPEVFKRNKPRKRFSWSRLLNGIQYVYDPGKGIIAKDESKQIVVLDPSIIHNTEYIDNKGQFQKVANETAIKTMDILGGQWEYKYGNVLGHLDVNGSPVEIEFRIAESYMVYVHSFQHGMKYIERIMLQGYQWDESMDSHAKTFAYKIRNFLEKNPPEKTGQDLYWNRKRMIDLLSATGLSGGKWNDYVSDDGEYVVSGNSWNEYFMIKTDLSGKLELDVEDKIKDYDKEFIYQKTFPKGTALEQIVEDFKTVKRQWFNEYKEFLEPERSQEENNE